MEKANKKAEKDMKDQVAAQAATRGPATNLRPAGPMTDPRTKRMRTRAAKERFALEEEI